MTIEFIGGTPGSGKSYLALEKIIDALDKGKHVIANFPLNFTNRMIKNGYADRFMYIPDDFLMGENGMALLWRISSEIIEDGDSRFFMRGEGNCLVVIDECGNYFPSEDSNSPVQKLWKLFLRQHRKMGFDIALISQGMEDINRTIKTLVEYEINCRKGNRVAPFKWLPWTLFFYVTYWRSDRKRQLLGSQSSIYVKSFAALYDTNMMFGGFEEKMEFDFAELQTHFTFEFGNTLLTEGETYIENIKTDLPATDQGAQHETLHAGCSCENCKKYRELDAEYFRNVVSDESEDTSHTA